MKGPWRTTEVATLHQHYGTGGAKKVHELLPHRSLDAIRAKAAAEGVRGIRCTTLGKRIERVYPQRDDIDMMIREGYLRATRKGDVKALAARIGRPAWWVQKRATTLGVTRTNRTRIDAWTAAELEIVDQWASASLPVIVGKLKKAGYKRTLTAVAVIMKRRSIDRTDPDVWTSHQLAPMIGRDPATVADWVTRRGLVARRVTKGPHGRFLLHRRELRRWIAANPQFIDLRRVDQAWFWDVMFGAAVSQPMPQPTMQQPVQVAA